MTVLPSSNDNPADGRRGRHLAFAVEDIDAVVAGLRARGTELVGELERYEDSYRLCYVRRPGGDHRRAGGADRLRLGLTRRHIDETRVVPLERYGYGSRGPISVLGYYEIGLSGARGLPFIEVFPMQ